MKKMSGVLVTALNGYPTWKLQWSEKDPVLTETRKERNMPTIMPGSRNNCSSHIEPSLLYLLGDPQPNCCVGGIPVPGMGMG